MKAVARGGAVVLDKSLRCEIDDMLNASGVEQFVNISCGEMKTDGLPDVSI